MKRKLNLLFFVLLLFSCVNAIAQNKVTGIVKNENGDVLMGATVSAMTSSSGNKETSKTDAHGIFAFTGLPIGGPYSFVISYLGMQSDTLTNYYLESGSNINLSIVLKESQKRLDDIVVIGYGTARKQDLSAAVATVPDMPQVKDRPVQDIANMVQGRVPGVTVVGDGGHPSQTPSVTIRGVGSKGTENVLYVVDGVPNAPYNPADVVSITVLKDAASAAIYGAFSGSAGVILVTTKQAAKGDPSIQYDGFTGIKSAWKLPQSLNAADEAKVANLAFTNAGMTPLEGWDAAKNPDAQVTRTDWIGSIFRNGVTQRHTLTMNAGTEKFSSLFQGRYENNQGTLLNTYNKNLSLRYNGSYKFNNHISFRQELFWNNNDSRDAETSSGYTGTILSAIYMPRSATVYYPDGSFGGVGPIGSPYLGIFGDAVNPVATLLRNQPYNRTNSLLSVSEFKATRIIPGLDFVSRFSYNQSNWLYKSFVPARTEPGKPDEQNSLSYSTNKNYNWLWENTLNYNKHIKRHSIGAMASMTHQEYSSKGFDVTARGFDIENDWNQFLQNASIFDQDIPNSFDIKDRNISYVGRISYSWADRYFMTASYRYDKADRLASDFRGKGFPGLTAAWKISSEPFFHIDAIDLLKVRASWGRIGNIGSVAYYYGMPTMTRTNLYQIGDKAPLKTGYYLANQFNPELSWETSQQTDIGLDLTLFKNRLTINADYFNKLTYDLIQQQTTGWPTTIGLAAPYINQGKIRNTGFEVMANWQDRIGEVTYGIGGNIATLKNRVVDIDGDPNAVWVHTDSWRSGLITPYRSTVGQPYYSYWLVKTDGIFQTDQEAQDYTKDGQRIQPNAKAGDLKFVDVNGDGKIDDNDRVYMGNAFPKLTYGFSVNASWKSFDFSAFFQGVGGVKLFNAFKESTLNAAEQGYNRWDKILDAWSTTNTGSNIPIISATDNNKNFATPSDWYLESGSYLRLKSLILGYTFKMPFKNSSLRVFFSGDNLLTFTRYSGMDPEVGGIGLDGGQFPVSRVYSIGARLKF
ncbi:MULTISPECIES: SusC/RagA family TonB-linked outer membrane protein [Chitinophagaceae]